MRQRSAAYGALAGLGLGLLGLLGCPRDGASRTAPPHLANLWHYEVSLDPDLAHAEARLCFEGARPREVRPGVDQAAIYLESAHWVSPGPARKLPVRDGKLQLEGLPTEGCLRYRIDLARASGQGPRLAMRRGDDLLASPALWLWRPERRDRQARASLRLQLPPGIHASTPWDGQDGAAELTASDFRYRAYATFGPSEPVRLEHAGAQVSLSNVGAPLAGLSSDGARGWLRQVVGAVADVLGHFPTERLQVVAVNVGPSKDPVLFGTVGRGGGASVLIFVAEDADAETLRRDWVLPHELSHLLLPYIERRDAWLPEGVATYYQEVLRARAGLKDERDAWAALYRTMQAARDWGTGRSLQRESADMHRTGAYRRVYWAGAAIALLADAGLRHESGGTRSLDRAIASAAWWDDEARTWSAAQVLAALDTASGGGLFQTLGAELLDSEDFPPVAPLFERLGVREVDGRVVLDDEAPLAAVRHGITAPRGDPTAP